jgi:hypothetical protein
LLIYYFRLVFPHYLIILYNLKQALEEQGIEAGKKEIKASLRRKIEQKLGIEGSLDALENKTNQNYVLKC